MEVASPLGVQDILAQVRLIQEVMKAVMEDGVHYGKIPGCGDKPTLLQPGAQKLLMTFRLAPEYVIEEKEVERGHREYRVQCSLKSIQSQSFVGQGVGSCSTMEGKFRYRVAPKKATEKMVPKEYWDTWKTDPAKAQLLLGGKGFSKMKDENGAWVIAEGSTEKVEHDNPADYYNTVLKMAKKRALVDATITATAASDIFTQDIEDMPEVIPGAGEPKEVKHGPTPSKRAPEPKPSAKTSDVTPQAATVETLKWFIQKVEAANLIQSFLGWAIDHSILLPNEGMEDWPLGKVPTSPQAFGVICKSVEDWELGKSGLAPEPTAEDEEWREFPLPFGKNAGTPMANVDKGYLFGLWANYTVETEYNGKAKKPETIEKDRRFRAMLDAAGRHYEFTKKD